MCLLNALTSPLPLNPLYYLLLFGIWLWALKAEGFSYFNKCNPKAILNIGRMIESREMFVRVTSIGGVIVAIGLVKDYPLECEGGIESLLKSEYPRTMALLFAIDGVIGSEQEECAGTIDEFIRKTAKEMRVVMMNGEEYILGTLSFRLVFGDRKKR